MLTRSAVHRGVIADVSDTWSIRGALLNQPRPRRRFTSKGFSWHHRGRGGGYSAPYEKSSIVLSKGRRQKTRPESLAGSATASGTQIILGAINLSHLASSRAGVGRVRGFVFVPMLRRVCNSSGAYRVLSDRGLFYQERNQ